MVNKIEYPAIFKAIYNNNQGKVIAFTAFLISKDGVMLTVAHPFYTDFDKETIINCANKDYKFTTKLIFKSDDDSFDFAFLRIVEAEKEAPKPLPLGLCNIEIVENNEVYGYGFGKAINSPEHGEFDLDFKIGGKISAGLSFSQIDGIRHVTFGDSGAPLFLGNDFNCAIGLNYQRDYTEVENQGYFLGYVLPISSIAEYLKGKSFEVFDFESLLVKEAPDKQIKLTIGEFKLKLHIILETKGFLGVSEVFIKIQESKFDYNKATLANLRNDAIQPLSALMPDPFISRIMSFIDTIQ